MIPFPDMVIVLLSKGNSTQPHKFSLKTIIYEATINETYDNR